jgi:hypothetical protein
MMTPQAKKILQDLCAAVIMIANATADLAEKKSASGDAVEKLRQAADSAEGVLLEL